MKPGKLQSQALAEPTFAKKKLLVGGFKCWRQIFLQFSILKNPDIFFESIITQLKSFLRNSQSGKVRNKV